MEDSFSFLTHAIISSCSQSFYNPSIIIVNGMAHKMSLKLQLLPDLVKPSGEVSPAVTDQHFSLASASITL